MYEGYFWFPDVEAVKLKGKVERGQINTVNVLTTSLEDYIHLQKIQREQNILMHGLLNNSLQATFIVSLNHRKENNIIQDNKLNVNVTMEFGITAAFYGGYFNKIDDIRFDSIIIAFTNLGNWISYHDLLHVFNNQENKKIIKNYDKTIEIYYKRPITNTDQKIALKPFNKVIYVEIKSENKENLEAFDDIKNTIQDFLNFFITGKSVTINSLYGVITDDHETKFITVVYKPLINESMNKNRLRSPYLQTYLQIDTRLEKLFTQFFHFRKKAGLAYKYYVSEMYEDHPLEIKLFLLAGFLERYHAVFLKNRSNTRQQNQQKLEDILSNLSITNIQKSDKEVIIPILKRHYENISLRERLQEIFEDYIEMILLNVPLLSLAEKKQIESCIEPLPIDKFTKSYILDLVERKKRLDLEILNGEDRYDILVEELLMKENENSLNKFIGYLKLLGVKVLSQEIAEKRNILAHVTEKHDRVESNTWRYLVEFLEFMAQICVLAQMDYTKQDILQIFLMDDIPLNTRIKIMVSGSIYN